jgi:hypothetical protein
MLSGRFRTTGNVNVPAGKCEPDGQLGSKYMSLILGLDSYMNANRHDDSILLQRKKGRVYT